MEEVGNDLSAGADDLVLEGAPPMAEQVAKEVAAEQLALAVAGEGGAMELENAGAGVADDVGTGTLFWLRHLHCFFFPPHF